MKRKFRLLWRWCLVVAMLVNTVAPVWAGAAMAADLLQSANRQATATDADDPQARLAASRKAGCETDTTQAQAPRAGTAADHGDCDCGSTGSCNCPCAFTVKLIDIRVAFAARHLPSASPLQGSWESIAPGPTTSVFRPPIA